MTKSRGLWSITSNGTSIWHPEAKLLLIKYIKRNPTALNETKGASCDAWRKIYNCLVSEGMPKSRPDLIRRVWGKMKQNAMQQNRKQSKRRITGGSSRLIEKLQAATIALLDKQPKSSQKPQPTKVVQPKEIVQPTFPFQPMTVRFIFIHVLVSVDYSLLIQIFLSLHQIKEEPLDEEDAETEKDGNDLMNTKLNYLNETKLNMRPVVVLNRMPANEAQQLATATAEATLSESDKYWKIMQQVAESELQLKLAQREKEEERMEFAREMHQKNMLLLDMKIKIQNLQIMSLENATHY